MKLSFMFVTGHMICNGHQEYCSLCSWTTGTPELITSYDVNID